MPLLKYWDVAAGAYLTIPGAPGPQGIQGPPGATGPSYVTLPPPVTTGTTIQTYTDQLGDVWVAKNGVRGGAWRRARDAVRARIYYNQNQVWPSGGTSNPVYDTIDYDEFRIITMSGVFTCQIPGVYLAYSRCYFASNAAGAIYSSLLKNNVEWARGVQQWVTGTGQSYECVAADATSLIVGDTVRVQFYNGTSQSGTGAAGFPAINTFSIHFQSNA
jgi:hypothetical protein